MIEIPGAFSTVDRIGSCLETEITIGRKFPNRFRKPNPSISMPRKPHRMRTRKRPKKKQIVPRILSRLWRKRF